MTSTGMDCPHCKGEGAQADGSRCGLCKGEPSEPPDLSALRDLVADIINAPSPEDEREAERHWLERYEIRLRATPAEPGASPPEALVEKWAALATSGDGRHPEAAETLSRCASELKGALAARSPAEPGASPPAGEDGCNVRPDGECVSGTPCIHSPSVAQALQRAHEEYFDTDDGTPAVPTPYWQFLAGAALRATPAEPGASTPRFLTDAELGEIAAWVGDNAGSRMAALVARLQVEANTLAQTHSPAPAGDEALERWVETGIYEPTPDAPREDALREALGGLTLNGLLTGLDTLTSEDRYRGATWEICGTAAKVIRALRGAVSRLRGLTRGQHEP
jgi:hypothetical protein